MRLFCLRAVAPSTVREYLGVTINAWNRKETNFEDDIASEKWLYYSNASLKINDCAIILLKKKKNILLDQVKSNDTCSIMLKKLTIVSVRFFLGQPV